MEVKSYSLDEFEKAFPNISIESTIRSPIFRLGNPLTTAPFAAYTVLFLIGIIGNSWVSVVIGRLVRHWLSGAAGTETPTGATATGSRGMYIYILALCCFDLLALICLPLLLLDLAFGQWTVPYSIVCKLFLTGDCLTKFGAPLLLTALSGFCYFSICKGNARNSLGSYFDLGSSRIAFWVVSFCLIAVAAFGAPMWLYGGIYYLVGTRNHSIFVILPKCSAHISEPIMDAFTVYSFLFGYVLPAALFTYFYSAVLYHVHRHARRMRGRKARYFWRAAKTSMCLVIFYLACWTPYWAMFMYIHYAGGQSAGVTNVVLHYFIHTLPYINACGYPILYTILNRNIKEDYNRMARRSREKREQTRQIIKGSTVIGKGRKGSVNSRHGPNWSVTNRTDDSLEKSLDTGGKDRSPTTPLWMGIEEEKELVQLK